jgi:hypothetical protein
LLVSRSCAGDDWVALSHGGRGFSSRLVGGEGGEKSPRRRFLFFPQGVGAGGSLSSSVLEEGGSQEVIGLRLELYRL